MIDKHISDVPARIWEEGRPAKLRIWEAEFNVASWIKVMGATGEVSLLVRYDDESGEHDCLVDRSSVTGESSNLMSGLVRMRFTGKVGRVQVLLRLSDPSMRFHVDELFVQRRGNALRREDKLISNY
ncbi:MAG: hypothetical protein P1U78_04160 [Alcanivoracaceae bacterium]|nr:hypothetical protein [Alcanivoracaceae bacterium]